MSPYELARRACKLALDTGRSHVIYHRRAALGDGWWIDSRPPRHGLWSEVARIDPDEAWIVQTGRPGSLGVYLRVVDAVERVVAGAKPATA